MKHRVNLPRLQRGAAAEGAGWWHETSNFRKFVPQILVTIINNLLLMDLSMMLAFPTLVIGALFLSDEPDEDGLRLNAEQASWLGSLVYIFQPLGSVVSGIVTEPLGRRKGMMFVNVPPLVGWLMLRFARSVEGLYAANAVLGLSIGFMEAPVLCYVGEISEPRVRSFLTASTGVMAQSGYLLVYLLGATMAWRTAATVCAIIPIISFLTMLVVPESPLWLLARGREEEASRSLRWLRGWVRPEAVRDELRELTAYADHTKRLMQQYSQPPEGGEAQVGGKTALAQTLRALGSLLRDLFRAPTRRPLILMIAFFYFHSPGIPGFRPYMVHIIEEFALPVDAHWATVASGVLGLLAMVLLMALVARLGKRRITLLSFAICAASFATIGTYAFVVVSGPSAQSTATATATANATATAADRPAIWVPLSAFAALLFFGIFGVDQPPWVYLMEVFPLRTRGVASGMTAGAACVFYFIAAKTYLQLESALGLHGVFWLNAAIAVAGFVYLYLQLPETEGKTLEEVEAYFAAKGKKTKERDKSNSEDKDVETATGGALAISIAASSPPSYEEALQVTHM